MTDRTPTETEHAEHTGHHEVGHIVSVKYLFATCAALLVLTMLTVAAAQVDFTKYGLPEMNIVVALAIAVVKASLVCLFFMHLFWDRPINAYIIIVALAFVGIFIAFAMTDTFEYRADQQQYERVELKGGDSKDVQTKLLELQTP
ncbi:MAG: cytochrome C oxidase subunit IV family protein [Planctomycetes bacterium]|nr:cytochrome C oxidase subunit IV family protein [Planctomycetota bacterium]